MDEFAVVLVAVVIVQKIVELIRNAVTSNGTYASPAWFDGWAVNLFAVLLGVGFAFAAGFDVLHELTMYDWPWWLDRIVTGIGIGSGAGFFSDLAGRSGPRSR